MTRSFDLLALPCRTGDLLLAAAAFFGTTARLFADPSYSSSFPGVPDINNSPTPISIGSSINIGGGYFSGLAYVGTDIATKMAVSDPNNGLNTGLSTSGSALLSASYDDIVISPLPGQLFSSTVPVTLHLAFHAMFYQNWTSMTLETGTDLSHAAQEALFNASGSFGFAQIDINSDNALNIATTGILGGQVHPTGGSGTALDSDGYIRLVSRTAFPVTSPTGASPVGAGYQYDDIMAVSGEMVFSATVPVNTPLFLDLDFFGRVLRVRSKIT
jgi:hypothetical protein